MFWMKQENNMKGVSPIIAVILLVMIVVGMGLTAYFFFTKTQITLQKGTEGEAEKTFQQIYTKIRIESITKDKIYVRNIGSFDIKKDSIQVYVNNETYPFHIATDILEPNRVYAIQLSPPLNESQYLIKITAGMGVEDSRYVNLAITTTTTITTTTIRVTTTTSTTTTTIPINNPPSVSRVAFIGNTTQNSRITLFVNATDPEDPSNLLNVNLWVGRCVGINCSSASSYEWNLTQVAMRYVSGNRFEYNWTIPYPGGTIVGATARATDTQGANSNWGDSFPLFTVGITPTTSTSTTTTSTTTTSTSTTTTLPVPWYFSNLPRRRPITISNSGSSLTNFQVALNITYDLDMIYNFADIRFTYFNGTSETQIPYWLENYQANSWAKVWVKVPKLISGSNTVYVYYGNSSLVSASNFDQTFTKDFEDSGLIASWHFDEGSGNIVRDASGNGNNGTIINPTLGTYWTSSDGGQWNGRSDIKFSTGSALNFTNSFSFVQVPNSASLNPTNAISIEAWIYPINMEIFKYRRPITISNPGSALTNYPVLITLNTQSLISQGKLRTDCGDIRFFDSDGITKLNYWLESGCNSANTRIWVKVPSIPSGSKTIYVYYGNRSAGSESSSSGMFLAFGLKFDGPIGGRTSSHGDHTCALLSDGTAKCWGYNGYGQLGDGTTSNRYIPVSVSGLTNAVAIASGAYHTCALLSNGTAKCWGLNNYGQLGDGSTSNRYTPVSVSGLTNAVAIASGEYHTCALLSDGTAKCWGRNNYGQLGDGSTSNRYIPVSVSGLTNAVAIASGEYHTCALLSDGTAKCWGLNNYGQLGDGTTDTRYTPTNVLIYNFGGRYDKTNGIYTVHRPPYFSEDYFVRSYVSQEPSVTVGEEEYIFMINKGTAYGIGANATHAFSMINNEFISTPISSGWNFITMTAEYIAGAMLQKLYINGVLLSAKTASGTIQTNSNPLIIFNPGILDEVKIYNRVLPEEEIRAHYERRKYTSAQITYNIGNEQTR